MSDFHIKGQLQCGAWIEIRQPGDSQTLELTITPKPGTKIEETAWIKDGTLRINASVLALMGLHELLNLTFGPKRRKKFLGIF